MTSTFTHTDTFARYLASKVAGDLKLMQWYYKMPSDEDIDAYIGELIILLVEGCLDWVEYGFKKNGDWVIVLKYNANFGILTPMDNRSGGVYPSADISDAKWHSFLNKNLKFYQLPATEQSRIEQSLPISRVSGNEPGYSSGYWTSDRSYSNGGVTLERKVFRPY